MIQYICQSHFCICRDDQGSLWNLTRRSGSMASVWPCHWTWWQFWPPLISPAWLKFGRLSLLAFHTKTLLTSLSTMPQLQQCPSWALDFGCPAAGQHCCDLSPLQTMIPIPTIRVNLSDLLIYYDVFISYPQLILIDLNCNYCSCHFITECAQNIPGDASI